MTIALPVYNGGDRTGAAIESVLAQTEGDLELLISDNCSTDLTADLCREYARQDTRVVYSRTERNLGAAANFDRCVDLANGEYFKWISHDDWIDARFLEATLPLIDKDQSVVTIAPNVEVVDDAGNHLHYVTSYTGIGQWSTRRLTQYRQMMDELAYCETHSDGFMMVAYVYALHRKSMLGRTRLILPFISSDYVLAAELALTGQLVRLDEVLSTFTVANNPAGTSANFAQWRPEAIQRMLSGRDPSRFEVMISTRRRHYEHVRAVMRSQLTVSEKLFAVEAATRPSRRRFEARIRRRVAERRTVDSPTPGPR